MASEQSVCLGEEGMRKTECTSTAVRVASRGRKRRAAARRLVTESPPLRNDTQGLPNAVRCVASSECDDEKKLKKTS